MDVLYPAIGMSLFLLSWLLVGLCESLGAFKKDEKT